MHYANDNRQYDDETYDYAYGYNVSTLLIMLLMVSSTVRFVRHRELPS